MEESEGTCLYEIPYAALFGQIELPSFPPLYVNVVAKECNAFPTVADVQA